jgi:hypothetical protein
MTAASTSQRRARSAALNAPCAVKLSRIGTPPGFLDIGSLPVPPGMPNDCSGQFDCRRPPHWKTGGSGRIFREWRQLSDAIAAPNTNVLKQSSWYRKRVTRSARSAGLRWSRGGIAPTFPHSNLSNVQTESRHETPNASAQRSKKQVIEGNPISTSYVERSNLTMRKRKDVFG